MDPLTGEILGVAEPAGEPYHAHPIPSKPGWFEIEGPWPRDESADFNLCHVDAQNRKVYPQRTKQRIRWDDQARVIRGVYAGKDTWEFGCPGQVLPNGVKRNWYFHDYASNDRALFAGCSGGIIFAIDLETGKELWRNADHWSRACLWNELLLHFVARNEKRFLVALSTLDGKENWRVSLPDYCQPSDIVTSGRFAIVREWHVILNPAFGMLVSKTGEVAFKSDVFVDGAVLYEKDMLVCMNGRLARINEKGDQIWSQSFTFTWEGQEYPLDELTTSVFVERDALFSTSHGMIFDSGVHVRRHDPLSGKPLWTAYCEPFGTCHSNYYHNVYLETRDSTLVVVSQGSNGCFIELLDIATGKSLKRFQFGF